MNPEATQPAHEGTKSNSDPKESPFLSTIHGEAVPPPPSGCDTPTKNSGATGDVVNANPSHTGAAGDVVNVNPSHTIKTNKMAPNRLINWNNLKVTVDSHLGNCIACKSKGLYLAEKSTCSFASSLEIVCKKCGEIEEKSRLDLKYSKQKIANLVPKNKEERQDLRKIKLKRDHQLRRIKEKILPRREKRMIRPLRNKKFSVRERVRVWGKGSIIDYEINLRAMMAAFYCGTGAADIAKAISFLGLPGGKSFERSFSNHSPKMCKLITSVVNGVVRSSLKAEIEETIREKLNDEKYTHEQIKKATKAFFDNDEQNIPDIIKKVGLAVSYDMGWQKRSTGKLYDSLSGHGFIFGCKTGNIIGFRVKSKACSICSNANRLNIPAKEHICKVNWDGASGAMEAGVALELCIALHDSSSFNIYIESVCSDDDSTMRAHLQHEKHGGKLPDRIPTPTFLADPSHRIKVMASPFFKMAQGESKDPMRCKKIDAMRLKKYIGCWIYQNRNLPIDQLLRKAKAPVEHLFNCHEWCDAEWCWAKQLDDKELELTNLHSKQMQERQIQEEDYESDLSTSSWETIDSNNSIQSPRTTTDPPSTTNPPTTTPPCDGMIASDDDEDYFDPTEIDEESEPEIEADVGLDEDELKECSFFAKYNETYDCDQLIFTPSDLDEMKMREKVMMERTERGYYRSKIRHEKLYLEIMEEYDRFITRPMLLMLNHTYSTQKNEAMNTSVASLAPKTKHYCTTNSLLTRVGIAAACQILGHAEFWSKVCLSMDFTIDANLLSLLLQRDKHKQKKSIRQSTIDGKRKRSSKKHEKINKEHKQFMDGYKAGCMYETGIAVAKAKKSLPKAADRNPEGTPKEQLRCPYSHPMYCTVLGHTSCASKDCQMKTATKAERAEALKVIMASAVEDKILRTRDYGASLKILSNIFMHILLSKLAFHYDC